MCSDKKTLPNEPGDINEEYLQKILSVNRKKTVSVKQLSKKAAVEEGENHLSVVLAIKLLCDDVEERFIIKMPPSNPVMRSFSMKAKLHQMEIYFYKKIYQVMKNHLEKQGNPFTFNVPNLIHAEEDCDSYILIFEDAGFQGFTMLDKSSPLDYSLLKLIIKELAKFHALSYALECQNEPLIVEFRAFNSLDMHIRHNDQMLLDRIDDFIKIMGKAGLSGDKVKPLQDLKKIAKQKFLEATTMETRFIALIHGDAWNNNALFRNSQGNPGYDEVMMLDYQMMKRGNILMDICYLLVTSTDLKFRVINKKNILEYYHSEFTNALKALKCVFNPDEYSLGYILEEYEKLKYYSVITGIIALPYMLLAGGDTSPEKMPSKMARCIEILEELNTINSIPEINQNLAEVKIE